MQMKHYKDNQGNVFGYAADGSQDHLIGDKLPITDQEAEALNLAKAQARFNALSYAEKRSSNYPPIGDQLDALWKGGEAAQAMLQKIQAVKAQFPKE